MQNMLLASILGFRLYLEAHYEMKLQGYPQKSFTTNTLAYFATHSTKKKGCFVGLTPMANVIKLFAGVSYDFS